MRGVSAFFSKLPLLVCTGFLLSGCTTIRDRAFFIVPELYAVAKQWVGFTEQGDDGYYMSLETGYTGTMYIQTQKGSVRQYFINQWKREGDRLVCTFDPTSIANGPLRLDCLVYPHYLAGQLTGADGQKIGIQFRTYDEMSGRLQKAKRLWDR